MREGAEEGALVKGFGGQGEVEVRQGVAFGKGGEGIDAACFAKIISVSLYIFFFSSLNNVLMNFLFQVSPKRRSIFIYPKLVCGATNRSNPPLTRPSRRAFKLLVELCTNLLKSKTRTRSADGLLMT